MRMMWSVQKRLISKFQLVCIFVWWIMVSWKRHRDRNNQGGMHINQNVHHNVDRCVVDGIMVQQEFNPQVLFENRYALRQIQSLDPSYYVPYQMLAISYQTPILSYQMTVVPHQTLDFFLRTRCLQILSNIVSESYLILWISMIVFVYVSYYNTWNPKL